MPTGAQRLGWTPLGRPRPQTTCDRLAKLGHDPFTGTALIYAYGSAAARLDPAEAAKAASDLLERLAKSDLDLLTR